MSFLRPELARALSRGREVIAGMAVSGFGLWLVWLGGYLLVPLGLVILALGAVLARQAWRRLHFVQGQDAPGVIELDEAQLGYLGPTEGGFVSLEDLVELRLIRVRGERVWRLKQLDGQALLIPVEAQGAGKLFDAFAALPGMDSGALVSALSATPGPQGIAEARVIWRRPAAAKRLRGRS